MGNVLTVPSSRGRLQAALIVGAKWLLLAAILGGALLTRLDSYLLFHSLAELFSIVIAFSVFILAWNSDALVKNSYLLIVGIGSLFIALLDSIHTLAFKGMGVIAIDSANWATQLWLAARYLQALTWLIAPFFLGRNVRKYVVAILYACATAFLLASIFAWGIFPAAYIDGQGLTPFKVVSEYVIIFTLVVSIGLLWRRRSEFDSTVMKWLVASLATGIVSEFAFTLYGGVTDAANLTGHVFKIVEFYFLYSALVETGFTRPYSLILRQMKKEGEAQVARQRARADETAAELDATFSSMADGVILYAPDGAILRMNAAAAKIFELSSASPDQPLIRRARLHSFIDADGLPLDNVQEMPVSRALAGEQVQDFVLGIPNVLTGDILWLATSAAPVRNAAGQVHGAVLTCRDITDRKHAQQEVERLNEELERRVIDRTGQLAAANEELEAFSYSVSHDLRAPLRHINGFIDLLERHAKDTLDEKSRHYMDLIARSAREMGCLIDDLLLFSRMGHSEMTRTRVELAPLVRQIIDEFQPETEDRCIEWKIAPLPPVTGDPAMLRMVLVNLISNALKFTRPRPVASIEISCVTDDPACIEVFVRDNGVGFDMAHMDKLFGVFQRLHRAEDFDGTGIGLATVRRIIARHGGHTWAEAEVDRGATFHFSLPTRS